MEQWVQDVRYSIRALRVAPVVSMAAILSLALAIGAATAIFSVVDGVLLKPFPVKDQERSARRLDLHTRTRIRALAVLVRVVPGHARASAHGQRRGRPSLCGCAAERSSISMIGSAMPLQRTAVTGELVRRARRARSRRPVVDCRR